MAKINYDMWRNLLSTGRLDNTLLFWYANRTRKGVDLRMKATHRILKWSEFPFLI